MIRFGLVLSGTALCVVWLTWIARQQLWIQHFPSYFYQTLILLVFTTVTIFAYLYRLNKPALFVQIYLLTMAIKLIAYGAYNLVVILKDKGGAAANVVFFMVVYVLFTGLEIAFLYQKISRSDSP